jgi:hypothetical protein
MLKINDEFSVRRDSRNWILVRSWMAESTKGKNAGKMTERKREQYFGSLDSLCFRCIDDTLDPDGGFAGMLEALEEARSDLSRMIKQQGLEAKRLLREVAK